ncbi:MAG: hypothetical protein U0Y68_08180 [Blastocatellia bacterium]
MRNTEIELLMIDRFRPTPARRAEKQAAQMGGVPRKKRVRKSWRDKWEA